MSEGLIAGLPRRGVVAVGGPEANRFLNDLVTSDIDGVEAGRAVFAALLSPQGKLLFDFIIFRDGDRYLLDVARGEVANLLKRLAFYRLRAKVDVSDLSEERMVVAAWGGSKPPIVDGAIAADPRLSALGWRAIIPPGADMAPDHDEATETDYDAHRIALGVPEGGIDFAFGEAFPHDADMDALAGVDFAKGCFIGQEVVSRMKHRGTARRRVIVAKGTPLPHSGTPVTANDKPLGVMGSHAGETGLALVRLDRAKEAMDAGAVILAGATPVSLSIPGWASFGWPTPGESD